MLLTARLVIEFCTLLREVSKQIPLKFHQQGCVPFTSRKPQGGPQAWCQEAPEGTHRGTRRSDRVCWRPSQQREHHRGPPAGPAPTGPFSSLQQRQGLHIVFYNKKPPKTPFLVNT